MLDKMPTISIRPEPIEIKDEPIVTDPRHGKSRAMKVYMENVTKYSKLLNERISFIASLSFIGTSTSSHFVS